MEEVPGEPEVGVGDDVVDGLLVVVGVALGVGDADGVGAEVVEGGAGLVVEDVVGDGALEAGDAHAVVADEVDGVGGELEAADGGVEGALLDLLDAVVPGTGFILMIGQEQGLVSLGVLLCFVIIYFF